MVMDAITMQMVEKEFSKRLKKPVSLEIHLGPNCIICGSLLKFIEQICSISNGKIKSKIIEHAKVYPVAKIGSNIEYMGMPTDKTTGVFLQFLMDLSSKTYFTDKESQKKVKALGDTSIEVYIAPFCRISPQQIRWAFEFSAINPRIKSRIVDITQFPNLATKNSIQQTPTTIINSRVRFVGACIPDELLRKIKLSTY